MCHVRRSCRNVTSTLLVALSSLYQGPHPQGQSVRVQNLWTPFMGPLSLEVNRSVLEVLEHGNCGVFPRLLD